MEHFIRIAFCIVAVALTPSGCRPTKLLSEIERTHGISSMRKEVKFNVPDSTFYTPNMTGDGCIINALECFKLELKRLQNPENTECEDPQDRIDDTLQMLNDTVKKLKEKVTLNSPGCKSCEEWDTKPFGTFLDKYAEFLEQANTIIANK